MSQAEQLVVAWAVAFVVNLIPAFMPPTWTVVSFFYIQYDLPLLALSIGSAAASALGRLFVALLARRFGLRLMTAEMKDNVEALGEYLKGRGQGLALAFVFFAPWSPFPSNVLFVAAGLAGVNLKLITPAFFVGRIISYAVSAEAASRVADDLTGLFGRHFTSAPALLVQLCSLLSIVLLTKIPWRRVLRLPARLDRED